MLPCQPNLGQISLMAINNVMSSVLGKLPLEFVFRGYVFGPLNLLLLNKL